MKRLLLFAALVVCMAGTLHAQETEHLKFKGIPIEGSVDSFGRELVTEGFSKEEKSVYKGIFMGRESYVFLNSQTDNQIRAVGVIFNECDTWKKLKSDYVWCVDMYTEKYGDPLSETRTFSGYKNEDNGLAMYAVKDDECNYRAIWIVPNGMISITISPMARVFISYLDGVSAQNNHSAIIDEI